MQPVHCSRPEAADLIFMGSKQFYGLNPKIDIGIFINIVNKMGLESEKVCYEILGC